MSPRGEVLQVELESRVNPGPGGGRAYSTAVVLVLVSEARGLVRHDVADYTAPAHAAEHAAQLRRALEWTWRGT